MTNNWTLAFHWGTSGLSPKVKETNFPTLEAAMAAAKETWPNIEFEVWDDGTHWAAISDDEEVTIGQD